MISNSKLKLSRSESEAATNLASFRSGCCSPSMVMVKTEENLPGTEGGSENRRCDSADVDSTEDETNYPFSMSNSGNISRSRQHRKLNSSRWTPEEDERLKMLVEQFGPKTWHLVAKHMSTATSEEVSSQPGGSQDISSVYGQHTAVQCMCRYKNVLDVCVRKGPWTEEEDDILRQLVAAAPGPHKIKWREVAEHLSGRLGKQCRERWFNQLDPSINMGPWKQEEDQALLEAQRKHGNRWNQIAKMLVGRTENAVKNRFNSVSFRRWKDAVEGCLELDQHHPTISSLNSAASSLENSPTIQSAFLLSPENEKVSKDDTQSLLPLSLPPALIGGEGSSGGGEGGGGGDLHTSVATHLTTPQPPTLALNSCHFELSQYHQQDSSDMLTLQRKRFRYSQKSAHNKSSSSSSSASSSTLSNCSPNSLDQVQMHMGDESMGNHHSSSKVDDGIDCNDHLDSDSGDGYEEHESSDSSHNEDVRLVSSLSPSSESLCLTTEGMLMISQKEESSKPLDSSKSSSNSAREHEKEGSAADALASHTDSKPIISSSSSVEYGEVSLGDGTNQSLVDGTMGSLGGVNKLNILKSQLVHVQNQRKELKICEEELKRKIRCFRKRASSCSSTSTSNTTPSS